MTNRQISCQRATWGGGGDVSLGSLPQGAHGETEAGSGISRARFGGKCLKRRRGFQRKASELPLPPPSPLDQRSSVFWLFAQRANVRSSFRSFQLQRKKSQQRPLFLKHSAGSISSL